MAVRDLRFATATDSDLRAAPGECGEYLRKIEDEGLTRMSRKQMLYSSREWSRRTGRMSEE